MYPASARSSITHGGGHKDPITCHLNFLDILPNRKVLIRGHIPHSHDIFTYAGSQRGKTFQGKRIFPRHRQGEYLLHDRAVALRQGQGHPGRLLQAQGGQGNMVHRARINEAVLHGSRLVRQDDAARVG